MAMHDIPALSAWDADRLLNGAGIHLPLTSPTTGLLDAFALDPARNVVRCAYALGAVLGVHKELTDSMADSILADEAIAPPSGSRPFPKLEDMTARERDNAHRILRAAFNEGAHS